MPVLRRDRRSIRCIRRLLYWNVRVVCYARIMDGELERLGERIAEQAAHLDAAMYRFLSDLHEFDERGGGTFRVHRRAPTGSPGELVVTRSPGASGYALPAS